VLGKAPQQEQKLIEDALDESLRCFELWQQQDLVKAQHRLHSFKAAV
jgi:PTH1 family peptidyl-tRNA hydrolase